MTQPLALLWFRQDLRLRDNPALLHAVNEGFRVLPVFIHDDENAGEWARGAASKWWLHHSLQALNIDLKEAMVFRSGKADEILPQLIQESGAQAVFWNRCYEPWRIARDKAIKAALEKQNIHTQSFNGSLMWEPWEVLKDDGTPYKVFTPYYRRGCTQKGERQPPLPQNAPKDIALMSDFAAKGSVDDLGLLPAVKWYPKFEAHWQPGEAGGQARLRGFIEEGLRNYKEGRDRPAQNNVSRLSPHLHFGEVSPRDVWYMVQPVMAAEGLERDGDHFCSELGWREFSYYLLYHFPHMPRAPLQKKFERFPWSEDTEMLERWQSGHTGIPLVDAGMRQLYETGWMHNRVRMIVASLLVKNMLLHWHHGENWFWDCLVDADLASNAASWQWVAGCGADAAPYFRIFNPETQAKKFDPDDDYIRQWIPEYGTPAYPPPIVDLKESRARALEAYQAVRG